MLEAATICNKNKFSVIGEICASFTFTPHTAKVISNSKSLVKMKKALHLWMNDMTRTHVLMDGNTSLQKALSLVRKLTGK